jgi:hypothetical protein
MTDVTNVIQSHGPLNALSSCPNAPIDYLLGIVEAVDWAPARQSHSSTVCRRIEGRLRRVSIVSLKCNSKDAPLDAEQEIEFKWANISEKGSARLNELLHS